jgi:hypothetical protein
MYTISLPLQHTLSGQECGCTLSNAECRTQQKDPVDMLWIQLRKPVLMSSSVVVVRALLIRTLRIHSTTCKKHCIVLTVL